MLTYIDNPIGGGAMLLCALLFSFGHVYGWRASLEAFRDHCAFKLWYTLLCYWYEWRIDFVRALRFDRRESTSARLAKYGEAID